MTTQVPQADAAVQDILLQREGSVATVVISNPAKRNALSVRMWERLRACFDGLAADAGLSCVVLRGAAGAFAAGADIEEFARVRNTRSQVQEFHEDKVLPALNAVFDCPVPVLAMIEGPCVGGGLEIASVCDLRIAASDARLGIPLRVLGFPFALGEMEHLYRLVGPATTAELLFEGRILGAAEALAKGLLTHVVEPGRLEQVSYDIAGRIARSAPLATRINKVHLRRLMADRGPSRAEERIAGYAFAETEDYRIGVKAFLDKTDPVFVGR